MRRKNLQRFAEMENQRDVHEEDKTKEQKHSGGLQNKVI